jgi:molybdenum cofactor cytidylyltransferase
MIHYLIMNITFLILAAGASSRMGQPKQLLDWGGIPLVRVVVLEALAAQPGEVVVVTGAAHQEVTHALAGLPIRIVANTAYPGGQSTSLHAGIAALSTDSAAVLVLLGDQPFVSAAIIGQICEAYTATNAAIVAPRYAGTRGNPVLFSKRFFAELMAVSGDQGARTLLAAHPEHISYVDFDDERPLVDIDTPEAYARHAPGVIDLPSPPRVQRH